MPFVNEETIDIVSVDDTTFKTAKPMTYIGAKDTIIVPAGQDTDFASVPTGITWLISRYGRWTKAAILHDYLWRQAPNGITKQEADGIFRRALRELGVPMYKRHIMWSAVRLTSIFKYGGLRGTSVAQILHLVLLWVTSIVLLAIPLVVVYAFKILFKILDAFFSLFDGKAMREYEESLKKKNELKKDGVRV